MKLEWRQYLAKSQTVIAGPCLSGARPEYFVLAFLKRFGPSIFPSERVQFPPFSYLSQPRNRGSECIADRTVKYLMAICIAKKLQRNVGKTCAFGLLLVRTARGSQVFEKVQEKVQLAKISNKKSSVIHPYMNDVRKI